MRGKMAGQRFDQLIGSIGNKFLRLVTNLRIVHRLCNVIMQFLCLSLRPEGDDGGQTLRRGTFLFGNTDARRNVKLLDVDPIGEKIWLIGHGVDQNRRGAD